MRAISVTARTRGLAADDAFARIIAVEKYSDVCPDVHSVEVAIGADGNPESTWEVEFRDGVLEWTESDIIDHEHHTMAFKLIDGDLDHFEGESHVTEDGQDVIVDFKGEMDLGMASLADLVEPLAQRSMEDSLATILNAVLGEGTAIAIGGR